MAKSFRIEQPWTAPNSCMHNCGLCSWSFQSSWSSRILKVLRFRLFTCVSMMMLATVGRIGEMCGVYIPMSIPDKSTEGKVHHWRGILRHWSCRTPTRATFALDANCWIRDDRRFQIKSVNKAPWSGIRRMSLEREWRGRHTCILPPAKSQIYTNMLTFASWFARPTTSNCCNM